MYNERTFGSSIKIPMGAIVFLVIVALAMAAVAYLQTADRVPVINGTHSTEKHLEDARQIQDCLEKPNNVLEVWKFTSHRRDREFFQVCQLDDGRFGLRLIRRVGRGLEAFWKERTSFVVKSGSYDELFEYVTARAVRFAGKLSSAP